MSPFLLSDVERAIRAGWGADTRPADAKTDWNPANPARGQCLATVLVVHDLLGGELLRGEVLVDGERVDHHWWNRLGAGVEVDLTREQFRPEEHVTEGVVIPRPPTITRPREAYETLRGRVLAALEPGERERPRES